MATNFLSYRSGAVGVPVNFVNFLSQFSQYYANVNGDLEPSLVPSAGSIAIQLATGALKPPFPVVLTAEALDGGAFKVATTVESVALNLLQPSQSQGVVKKFAVSFAPDDVNYSRIFDIFPRLAEEFAFSIAEYQGFVATKGNIFAYFLNLLQTSGDPSKAIQLDFPGGSVDVAYNLGAVDATGWLVPGQVFEIQGNEDLDVYRFTADGGDLKVTFASGPGSSGDVTLRLLQADPLIEGATTVLKEVQSLAGAALLDVAGLAADTYFLSVDAEAGANIFYSLDLSLSLTPPQPPLPPLDTPLVLNAETAQLLYVAYYNRPADPGGLQFWKDAITKAGLSYSPRSGDTIEDAGPLYTTIVDDFGSGDEYLALFVGKDVVQSMNAIYQSCFGRDADLDPITKENYWVGKIDRDEITFPQAAVEVALGARGSDLQFINNRIASADTFLQQLDTPLEQAAFAGEVPAQLARTWLQGYGATAATALEADAVIAQIVAASSLL